MGFSNEDEQNLEKINSSQLEIQLNNKKIFQPESDTNEFINIENRSSFSHKINVKNIPKEFENNFIKEKKSLKKSFNYESSYSLSNREKDIQNYNINKINNIENMDNKDIMGKFYPMDTEVNNNEISNNNENNIKELNYSNRKVDNYPIDNIESFNLKNKSIGNNLNNNTNNDINNNLNANDIDNI